LGRVKAHLHLFISVWG